MKKLLILGLLLSLVGNVYPVVNVLAILGMVPAWYWGRRKQIASETDASPATAMGYLKWAYVYWIVSYVLTGAPLSNLVSFDFLRRDGAILVAYLPLFLFCDLGLDAGFVRRSLTAFLTVMAAIATLGTLEFLDAVGVPLGLSNLPDQLQFVHYARLSEYGFHGLFQAHNSAGAVYGMAACLAFALLIFAPEAKVLSWQTFWFAACFTGLALSKSRTSYVAFLGTFAMVFLTSSKNYRKVLKIGVLVLLPLAYFWLTQPEVVSRAEAVTSLDDPNVVGRLALYADAVQDISLSPLVGVGFGRFNDDYKEFSGIPHFIYLATNGEVINDPTHAHNSYLHFFAEGGAVGLALMLGVWVSVLKWVRRMQARFPEGSFGYAFAKGIQACLVLEFLISFTEHSMGTAVTSLAVLSMVGLLRNLVADQSAPKIAPSHVTERVQRRPVGPIAKPGFRPA